MDGSFDNTAPIKSPEGVSEQGHVSISEAIEMPPQELINVLGEADFSTSELETPLIVRFIQFLSFIRFPDLFPCSCLIHPLMCNLCLKPQLIFKVLLPSILFQLLSVS
jgi:hypothetical protein